MRCETLRNMGFAGFVGFGLLGTAAGQAEAQLLGRRKATVQEAVVTAPVEIVTPPVVVVSNRVKVRPRKVVIRERRGVLARVPAVVTSTPVVLKSRTIESSPVVEERVVRPDPIEGDRDFNLEKLMETPVLSPPR